MSGHFPFRFLRYLDHFRGFFPLNMSAIGGLYDRLRDRFAARNGESSTLRTLPQWRTRDFTHPSATAEVHFSNPSATVGQELHETFRFGRLTLRKISAFIFLLHYRQSDPLPRRRSNHFHSRNCGLSNVESFHHSGSPST